MNNMDNNLRTLLRNNIVLFTYRKVNGETRKAIGTRNLSLATEYTNTRIPTPTGYEQPNSYYDVECMGWRSWKEGNVISIEGIILGDEVEPHHTNETPNTETKKGELPKREIPVKFHTADGTEKPIGTAKMFGDPIDLGNLPIGNGKTAPVKMQPVDLSGLDFKPISKEEIRKAMDDLEKDIKLTPNVVANGIAVDDFARLVARYVVDELGNRLKKITL